MLMSISQIGDLHADVHKSAMKMRKWFIAFCAVVGFGEQQSGSGCPPASPVLRGGSR